MTREELANFISSVDKEEFTLFFKSHGVKKILDKYNLKVVAVFSLIFSLIIDAGVEYTLRNNNMEVKMVYMLILFPIIFIIVGLMLALIWFGVRHAAKNIIVDNIDIA